MKKQKLIFIFADIIFIIIAVFLAFVLRFEGYIPQAFVFSMLKTAVFAILFSIPIYLFLGLYSFSWPYVGTRELVSLFTANIFSFAFSATWFFLTDNFSGFPRSALVISYLLIILFTGGIRISKRIYLQAFSIRNGGERVFIIGAGDAGEQVLRNISGSSYSPEGFIDDDISKRGSYIHGVKVLGGIEDIPFLSSKYDVKSVIIAVPSAADHIIKKAVQQSRKAGIKNIKILPPLSDIINGQVFLSDIKEFKMEDLLKRRPLVYNQSGTESFISGKTILITGGAGSIGSEIARQVSNSNPSKIIVLDQDETGVFNICKEIKGAVPVIADIQDKDKIEKTFGIFRPEIVFHAAAYKHVPLMESEPEEAVKNNIFGTKIVAEAARGAETFIFISTDKAVNPTSVMGACKRAGEMICQKLNGQGGTKFISVRFGNVLGSRGSVIPVFQEQIRKGGPVEVTTQEMERFFMTIPEAVGLVIQAASIGKGSEVFVLNMGSPIRIIDLAKDIIRLSGLEPDKDIPIVFSGKRTGEKISEETLYSEEILT